MINRTTHLGYRQTPENRLDEHVKSTILAFMLRPPTQSSLVG